MENKAAITQFGSPILEDENTNSYTILGVDRQTKERHYPQFGGTSEFFSRFSYSHFGGDLLYIARGSE